jgi:hypothetical protein
MLKSFKPIHINHLEVNPGTITDCHGKLLVWYLPNILVPERQVCRCNISPAWIDFGLEIHVFRPQTLGTGDQGGHGQIGQLAIGTRMFLCNPRWVETRGIQYFPGLV